ncbi:EamA family transporter [Candidatus Woesearchaeota archaeon]|nr:EamA family transporter [Nanoarchaeota archaeon]MCB9370249.1 EamA family transporter [Candidatus Woesearchaeota archaeon]USN44774.1 MAG: EamA family transporter [Candidatus Woesearchaeota archaeon]
MSLWILFASISAFSESLKALLHRKIMLSEDPVVYALVENILAALIFLIFISSFSLPKENSAWLLITLSSALWLSISILSQYSYKYTKVTIQEPLKQTRLLWVLLLSIIFLHELLTRQKILGTLLICCGLAYLSYDKKKKFGSLKEKGVLFTLATAFLFALVTIVDKAALKYFNPETYGFLVYLFPGLALILINSRKSQLKKLSSLWKNKFWFVGLVALSSFSYYYFKLKALQLADTSLVFPLIRSASILTILGGIIFLKEKEQLSKKLLSSAIVFVGVLCLVL